jgi:glycosyltransferase involved in cell wall biosynthesis
MLERLRPDVVNVHNIHWAKWPAGIANVCQEFAPTVWTLHDMWSFTGRCAYAYDCEKFLAGCDASCPTPQEYPRLDPRQIAPAWAGRLEMLAASTRLAAVTPSQWLAREAQRGMWAGRPVEVIPYGVPLGVFEPVPRQTARDAMGIRTDDPVVLVAAHDLGARYKGGRLLRELLDGWRGRRFTLLSFGKGLDGVSNENIRPVSLGWIEYERARCLAYAAADIYMHCAIADNFPNVVLESIACGTPVLALPAGGVPELVRPGMTGWLAGSASAEALSGMLGTVLDEVAAGVNLRDSCRRVALEEYSRQQQASRYLALFDRLRSGQVEQA